MLSEGAGLCLMDNKLMCFEWDDGSNSDFSVRPGFLSWGFILMLPLNHITLFSGFRKMLRLWSRVNL